MREAHDDLEEFLALGLGLGYRHWSEPFEVATNTILLLNGEPNTDQRFEQVNGVNRGNVKLVSLLPPNTGNANAAGLTVLRRDWTELSGNAAVGLVTSELDKASACLFLVLGPIVFHAVKITLELEASLQRMDGIGVEVLGLAHSHG